MYMCRKINKALNRKKDASALGGGAEVEAEEKVEAEGGKKRERSLDAAMSSETASTYRTSSSSSNSSGSAAGSGVTLRGMDDDEIEGEEGDGGAVDGQDDDLFLGGADSDNEGDYESEEDGEGYESLGEQEIFLEEKAKRAAAASVGASEVFKTGAELRAEMTAEALRDKMLREVLGLPERCDSNSLAASIQCDVSADLA